MMRFRKLPAVLLALVFTTPAAVSPVLAQPAAAPTEQVTVTSTRLQDQIHSFVQSFAAPTPALGKLARWHDGICPVATGMSDELGDTIVKRVRAIAAMAGAPVAPEPCKGNIDIVFTYNPQLLLDDVLANHPVLLGYHDVAQAEALAKVSHPVQSWYATQTADDKGTRYVDDKQTHARTTLSMCLPHGTPGSMYQPCTPRQFDLVGVRAQEINGSRVDDGLSSELFHVIVTVNVARMGDDQIPAITDYVALLALAQTNAFETCAAIPSITSTVTDTCPQKPAGITESDLAYLRALYKTDTSRTLTEERRDIADEMNRTLAPR